MAGFPALPASNKGGDPARQSDLLYLSGPLPAEAAAWFAGAIVIPDLAAGQYKLCDAAGSVLKGIGVVGVDGKAVNVRMQSIFLPPATVIVKYTQAAVLKVGSLVKTRTDATFDGTALTTDAFAQIMGKVGQGAGGTDVMTDIVQNDYVKLRLFDARG
jgi:hypothetical protein